MANNGDATQSDAGKQALISSVVRVVADLTSIGMLSSPNRVKVEKRSGGGNRTMCMVKLNGPRPEGGGGIQDEGTPVLGDYVRLPDTHDTPAQGHAGSLEI